MDKTVIQRYTSWMFHNLGSIISKKPFRFIVVPLAVTATFLVGFLWINGSRDVTHLFSPKGSRSLRDRATVEALFPMNYSHDYNLYKSTRMESYFTVIVQAKDGGTMLRNHIFKEILEVDDTVRETELPGNLTYSTLCARNERGCYENEPLLLGEQIDRFQRGKFQFRYPIDINQYNFKVTPYVLSIGGVTLDHDGYVTKFVAFRLCYILDDAGEKKAFVRRWERRVADVLKSANFENIELFVLTGNSFADELQKLSASVLPLSGFSIIMVIAISSLTCMTVKIVQCKPWLGLSGCVSAGLSVITAFGFLFLCGIEYADVNMALPFLVIGIGVDDAFIMISYWRRTSSRLTVKERMEATYSEAAVSITITSLTDVLSFAIGIFNPFPVVHIFCTYATVCILFVYFYQITFFGACMALSGFREEKMLNPFTCRPVLFQSLSGTEDGCYVPKVPCNNGESQDNEEYFMKLLRDKLGKIFEKRLFKITAFALYLIILGGGIWNLTLLSEGLKPQDILVSESATTQFVDRNYKYFTDYPYTIQVVITEPLNYANATVQEQIQQTLRKFETSRFTAGENLTQSWLKFYLMFSRTSIGSIVLRPFDLTQKQDFIDGLTKVFLKYPQTKDMRKDILLNEDSTEILASRFFVTCKNIGDKYQERQLIEEMREIADHAPLPMVVHSALFPNFEQLVAVRKVTLQTIGVATALSLMTFFIFAPNLKAAIVVSLTVLTVQIESIGYLSLLHVNLDVLSMVMILMCVGFSINYPSHMAFSYTSRGHNEPISRMRTALSAVVLPILQGSLTTVVGLSILALQPSYVFFIFFKIGCLMVILTSFHSIFIIPIGIELLETL